MLHLIIFLELLLTLPKDTAGVGDVKENSQKEAKLDGKKYLSYDSIIQLKPSFSRISSSVKLILIYKMFKLQYYLLVLTFSRVYKNKKTISKLLGGGGGGKYPLAHPVATPLRLALEILQRRGGISPLDNEDEPIF